MANIMIADDSDAIRLVLQDIIEIGNHKLAAEAKDGQETTDMYKSVNPDILLLDLAMPKKDGLEVVKEVISMQPDAKIILITASDNQKIINQCLEAGAVSNISKPFDFDKVLQVINAIR